MNGYDEFTKSLARYPTEQKDPRIVEALYLAAGLAGEAGEAVDKIKKWHRDGVVNEEAILLELGDTIYYVTRLANLFNVTLEDVIRLNVVKLTKRKENGTIHGSGDYR